MKVKKTIKIKKANKDKILFAYHSLVNAEAVVADLIFSKRESFYKLLVKNGMNPECAKTITFCRADGSDAAEKWLEDLEAEFECVLRMYFSLLKSVGAKQTTQHPPTPKATEDKTGVKR